MTDLFSTLEMRGLTLPNRVVLSPMCQYNSTDGCMNDWHLMHYGKFATGGAGLVITEMTQISPDSRITHNCAGLYSDDQVEATRRVVDFCKTYGTAKMGVQIGHAGRKASTHLPAKGAGPLSPDESPWQTVAPSAIPYGEGWHEPRAATGKDLAEIKAGFVDAVKRADEAGFDLVELHGGHGYLLHQFLSPLANHRTDAYGGSTENRMRFVLEVFEASRVAWPDDKPMGIRLSATDWVEGGWTPEETVLLSAALKDRGIDYVDVSTGGLHPAQQIPLSEGFQVEYGAKVRKETGATTMSVGLIADPVHANAIIASGKADFVKLGRGMLYDPHWTWHAALALGAEIAYPPKYAMAQPKIRPMLFADKAS